MRRRLSGLSLRARLVAVVTGLLVLALLVTGAVTLAVLQRVLMHQVDDDLRATIVSDQAFHQLTELVTRTPEDDDAPSDYVVQVTAPDGTPLHVWHRPSGSQGSDFKLDGLTLAQVYRWDGEPQTVPGQDGDWRVIAKVDTKEGVSLAVARPLAGVHASVAKVAGWLLLVGVAVVLAGAVLGAAAVRRAFRPLREVEAVTTAFGDGDTSRRVALAAPGTEVGRLGRAVNAMLDRIETSLAAREASESRMRRFVGDASHELRTPLAAVRGFAELHRLGAVRRPEDVSTAFDRIEHEAIRMGGLVEDLLVLARLDEQRPMHHDPVDLLMLSADAGHDARALAPDRTVRVVGVDGAPPAPAPVVGDEARLRQVLTNLMANAVRHTPAGTPVELGVGTRDGEAVWQVVDHGPGIPPQDAERVFERFWRADTSRARGAGGGAGLGMAIVAAIVQAHGGTVRVVGTPGGGATIEVRLPLADAAVRGAADLPELPEPPEDAEDADLDAHDAADLDAHDAADLDAHDLDSAGARSTAGVRSPAP